MRRTAQCLPILGMVSRCATPDLAMLRWIAHISGKDNAMANMLSRAQFDEEDDMVSEDEEVGVDFFESAYVTTRHGSTPTLNEFNKGEYDGEWLQISKSLKTMAPEAA